MNEQTLKDAIRQLPSYQPSENLWQQIESEMELQKSLSVLPTYAPTDRVWEGIEQSFQPAKRVQMWRRWSSVAAAAIAVLLIATFWWTNEQQPTIAMSHNVADQKVNLAVFTADWNEDEDAFLTVEKLCADYPFLCKNGDFQNLQNELTELQEAKAGVELAMKKYGKQTRLIHQIKQIEQERSEVLKEMVKMI